MTTFITGGTSTLGRILVKELVRQGEPLRILVRPNSDRSGLQYPGVEFIRGDITDLVAVRKGVTGCARVCHLAGLAGTNAPESEWWRVNRDGTRNVLQAAHELRVVSMVQVSNLTVLGPTKPGEVGDESRASAPGPHSSLYQKTKFAADEIAQEYADKGLSVKIVYPGFGYGYTSASGPAGITQQILLRMAQDKPAAVPGRGKKKVCVSYYRDVVQGMLLAHERGVGGEGYILGGETLSFREMSATVAELLGQESVRQAPLWLAKMTNGWGPVSKAFSSDYLAMIGKEWNYTSEKAQHDLGWQFRSFADGIAETWADYQAIGWERPERDAQRVMPRA